MKLLQLLIVIFGGILLCKAAALGIVLLFMYIQGKRFSFEAMQWDEWLLNISEKKLFWMFMVAYLLSAAVSSLAAYGALNHFGFQYAIEIALLFLVVRMAATWLRYRQSGKEYLSNQIAKIHKIVLEGK